jgi:hypothetical protein
VPIDHFDGEALDPAVWVPHYLPAWSSRAATRATTTLHDSVLVLSVPVDQGLWCPGQHDPLRVSGVMSGSWSGPVGSTRGQQRFREGLRVREEQPRFEGWLPAGGTVSVRARMDLSPRSMAALWLSGFEDDDAQQQCGELCVFEVFGDSLGPDDAPSAEVGVGIKPFRDPALVDDFAAPRVATDVTDWHDYAVTWDVAEAVFTLDGDEVRRCPHPPTYPLQLMLAVFDFPDRSTGRDGHLVPRLEVDLVSWEPG